MSAGSSARVVPWYVSVAVLVAAVVVFGLIGISWIHAPADDGPHAESPVTVPLFVDPDSVVHEPRLRFSYDRPEALAKLRQEENLDKVVFEATSDEEAFRLLTEWTGAQWEPSTPTIYPPPDARVILRDIRSGVTGGFCGQYCFVLTQAIQSLGGKARLVTIDGHEVVEAWLADQRRWVMFDPTFVLQVVGADGRTLNALEIRRRLEAGKSMKLTPGHRSPFEDAAYLDRFKHFAIWIRNDFVSRPLNFDDFSRYRVWFSPASELKLPRDSLSTWHEVDLYSPPDQ